MTTAFILVCSVLAVSKIDGSRFALCADYLKQGKYYTLLTYAFFHNGKIHYVSNMITLLICGTALERRMGHLGYALLVVISAICSGIVSIVADLIIGNTQEMTVGLSGAEYAILAALGIYILKSKHKTSILLIIYMIYEIVKCFGNSSVNNICHIGGAICGIFLFYIFDKIATKSRKS